MRPEPRTPTTLLAVLLLALAGPLAAAQPHGLPVDPGVPDQPAAPPPPAEQTQAPPVVNRVVGGAYGLATQAYNGTSAQYRVLRDAANGPLNRTVPRELVVYRDGAGDTETGPDARFAGFGPVRTFGASSWVQAENAAHTGRQGYSSPTAADGTYPTPARSMLLTPEIDLRVGIPTDAEMADFQDNTKAWRDEVRGQCKAGMNNLLVPLCAIYPNMYWKGIGEGGYGAIYNSLLGRGVSSDTEARLTFQARYNLGVANGTARDGVALLVFTAPPQEMPSGYGACAGTCTRVGPSLAAYDPTSSPTVNECPKGEKYSGSFLTGVCTPPPQPNYGGPALALDGHPGFIGQSVWRNYTLDLTPWIGQSVWVGFYFASHNLPPPGYFSGPMFAAQAGFHGFHLDNLVVTAPSTPDNVQVRPLWPVAPNAYRQELPMLLPNAPVQIRTEVRNAGMTGARIRVHTQVVDFYDPDRAYSANVSEPMQLASGEIFPVEATYPAPPLGVTAVASVLVERLSDGVDATEPGGNPFAARVAADEALHGQNPTPCKAHGDVQPVLGGLGLPKFESLIVPTDGGGTMGTGRSGLLNSMDLMSNWLGAEGRRVLCDSRVGDGEPRDDAAMGLFQVQRVHAVLPQEVLRSGGSLQAGDTIQYILSLANAGNTFESLTLQARLYEVSDPKAPVLVEDVLPPDQIQRTVEVAPGDIAKVEWELRVHQAGQYRLFVHDLRDEGLNLTLDLLPPALAPLDVPFVDLSLLGERGGMAMDGVVDEWAWRLAAPVMARVKDPVTDAEGHLPLRLFHDGSNLYVAAVRTPTIIGDFSNPLYTTFTALFHDGGDPLGRMGGADGIYMASTDPPRFVDLHLDPVTNAFVRDTDQTDLTGRAGTRPATRTVNVYEFMRPLRAGGQDLDLDADGLLGLYLNLTVSATVEYHYPREAHHRDGGLDRQRLNLKGVMSPDGSLADEMDGWQRLRLLPPGEPRVPLRVFLPGFGVDRGAPPIFLETLEECPASRGWTQTGVLSHTFQDSRLYTKGGRFTEKWNCGPVGPAGTPVFFEGMDQSPNTTCSGATCPPFSLAGTTSVRYGILYTPPIDMGLALAPWLVFQNQVSGVANICDGSFIPPNNDLMELFSCSAADMKTRGPHLEVKAAAKVFLQVWDPDTQQWTTNTLLRPDGGYSSEDSTGITDAARNGFQGRGWKGGSGCSTAPREACGWWDPAGFVPAYRPQNDSIPSGGAFAGSPWRVSRIPLFGLHGDDGGTPVEVRGATVRFGFAFARPAGPVPYHSFQDPPYDVGWRLGAVAVLEAPRLGRDVSVADVRVATDAFDPVRQGVAPDADLPVAVTVRNEGSVEARNLKVQVHGFDPTRPEGPDNLSCSSPLTSVMGVLLPQGTQNVTVACRVTAPEGALLRLRAEVIAGDGDEFPFDNRRAQPDAYPVKVSPDVAVRVGASPQTASDATTRRIFLSVENRGNVPLSGFDVLRTISQRSAAGNELIDDFTRRWHVQGVLGIGQTLRIEDPALNVTPAVGAAMEFRPPAQGIYDVTAQVFLATDGDGSNDVESASLKALRELYLETFDAPRVADPAVVGGTWQADDAAVWKTSNEGDAHAKHLRAGDPGTGRIPANTDAVLLLPPLDLTPMSGATLSFSHRYDLERNFDAARVEASTDGKTWLPLTPKREDLAGLPEGYPSLTVFGPSPLVENATQATAVAYTGRTGSLAGAAPDGYIASEFNLADHPGLRRVSQLESFRFEGFAPKPLAAPVVDAGGQEIQFRHPTWELEGAPATAARSWWIENLTRSQPAPHSGSATWWSGFAGEGSPQHPALAICNGLATRLDLAPVPATHNRVVLTWWDWRSGWQDDPLRSGRGGQYAVGVQRQDSDRDGIPDAVELQIGTLHQQADSDGNEFSDGAQHYYPEHSTNSADSDDDKLYDGWERSHFGSLSNRAEGDPDQDGLSNLQEQTYGTHPTLWGRDTDLDGVADGEEVALGTDPRTREDGHIIEVRADGWTRRALDLTPYRSEAFDVLFLYTWEETTLTPELLKAANRGWFIDDVEATAWIEDPVTHLRFSPLPVLPLQDMDALDLDPDTQTAGPWRTFVRNPECTSTAWSLVGRGPTATPAGWQVEEGVAVPGAGKTSVWRFSSGNDQGYPHLADARLVTPAIDLSQIEGDSAKLRFNHKYGFESSSVAPAGDPAGAMTVAVDGGAIEFQVLDEVTGQFGPWQQLFRGFRDAPDRVLFTAAERSGRIGPTGLVKDTPPPGEAGNREKVAASGYPAIEARGMDWLTGHPRLTRLYAGQASSFEVFPGKIQHPQLSWMDYPASYLFSGISTGLEGWREEAWDISPLIGKQVRFGFHAASNPHYGGTKPLPYAGWAISGVAVEGEMFAGLPVQVRLRVATDGSLLEGSWDVDDLLVAGTPFTRNVAVQLDNPDLLVLPGTTLHLHANVTNLGDTARPGLALAIEVMDAATKVPHPAYAVLSPDPDSRIDPNRVLPAFAQALVLGSLDLSPSGTQGSKVPVHIQLVMPETAAAVQVRLTVLEADGPADQATYRPPSNQVSGATQAAWNVAGQLRSDLRLVKPAPDNDALVVATPGSGTAGQNVSLQAGLSNHGTTLPHVVAHWRLDEVKRKGPATEQGGIKPEELGFQVAWSQDRGVLQRGETAISTFNRTPPRDGLYRASVAFHADGVPVRFATLEFLVGSGGTYHQVDFSNSSGQSGWRNASAQVNPSTGGGTPPESQWREFDGRFIWGVTPAQAFAGITYCNTPNAACHAANQAGTQGVPPPDPTTYYGMEGIGLSPRVDLGRVPGGRAMLTLRHGHNFETDDGGRLEVRPLKTPTNPAAPTAAFKCADDSDAWFALQPRDPEGYAGEALSRGFGQFVPRPPGSPFTVPYRINPLAPAFTLERVVGGPPVAAETLQFDLARPARSLCAEVADTLLINYTVEFRLRAGTRPGSLGPPGSSDVREGATGWQVDAIQVSSIEFGVEPRFRALPIVDGAPKQFTLEVENRGPVPDTFQLRLDAVASSLPNPNWVQLQQPQVTLNPGQRARVPFTIDVPPDASLSRGTYAAVVAVASERNPLVEQRAQFDLVLDSNPLADLALQLSVEAEGTPPAFEAGTVVPIHATVHNVGQRASPETTLRLVAAGPDGESRVIGTAALPPLCPAVLCGKGGSAGSATLEWMVPAQTGLYQLVADADADGLVLESKRENNVRVLAVRAVPLNRPDLRMDDLHVKGLSPDGFAEEGALVQLFANVTNVGNAPAEQVQVRIMAGSAQLSQVILPLLNPGETRSVSAYKAAPAGQTVLSAIVLLPAGLETNVNNNEVRRILHARGHDVGFTLDATNATVAAGSFVTVMGTVRNRAQTVERVVVSLEDAWVRQDWALAATPNPVVIAPNGTAPVVLTLRAPEDATSGPTPLRLLVRAVAKPSVQANATLLAQVPARTPAPAVAAGNLTAVPGEILLPFTLRSNANTAQRLTVTLREPGWEAVAATLDLAAFANATGELLVTVPPGAAVGTHPVHIQVQQGGSTLVEGVGRVEVGGRTALQAHWMRALPSHESLGSRQLAFELAVTNTGNLPARVRAIPADLAQGYFAEAVETPLLQPGGNASLVLPVLVSPDAPTAPAGRVELWMVAENGGAAEATVTLELPALDATPNLVMARLEVTPRTALGVGEEARLRVRVENRGLLGSPATNLSGYVNGVLVQDAPLPALAPGGWHEVNLTWRASAAGRQLVTLVADGNHRVTETSEDDNGGSVEVTVERGLLDPARQLPAAGWGPLFSLAVALALARPRRRGGKE